MSTITEICDYIKAGRAKAVKELVVRALEEKVNPAEILNGAMIPAMSEIGVKFKNDEIYVPEVLVAARAMNMGLTVLRPALIENGVSPIGKAIICTVKGDLHDIGKNLVKMMIEGAGIECIDLGVDVDADTVVKTVKETGAQIVCLSALLTTTMTYQAVIIKALSDAGLRDKVKVLVGGAPVTESFALEIGADAYTIDAGSAAETARKLLLA